MKAFLATCSKPFTRNIAIELIPLGVEIIEADSRQQLLELIREHADVVSLITEYPEIELHHEIRNIRSDIRVTLIVHQNLKPPDLIKLSHFGIQHILTHMENPVMIAEEILRTILGDRLLIREKRIHRRVLPKIHDKIKCEVFNRGQEKPYKGAVINISAGGFAVRLNEQSESRNLKPGQTYDPVMISLDGTEFKTMSIMVSRCGDIAGFKFDQLGAEFRRKLSEYIYIRL